MSGRRKVESIRQSHSLQTARHSADSILTGRISFCTSFGNCDYLVQLPTPPFPATIHTGGPQSLSLPPSHPLAYFPVPPPPWDGNASHSSRVRGHGVPPIHSSSPFSFSTAPKRNTSFRAATTSHRLVSPNSRATEALESVGPLILMRQIHFMDMDRFL